MRLPTTNTTTTIFRDLDTCRRYLIARNWKLSKAQNQLEATLRYKLQKLNDPNRPIHFWQSPLAMNNPWAVAMRIIGWDTAGRPICYTCFAESHDRWNAVANTQHMELLMEATTHLLRQRRADGLNRTATSRQWIWVIDFQGYGLRDQNPQSGILTSKLLQHYPEMLYLGVFLNAPWVFRGVYKILRPLLDASVQQKVLFVTGTRDEQWQTVLTDRLGADAARWIVDETADNERQRTNGGGQPKKYWVPAASSSAHDSRGMASYIQSPYYVKTPGEAYEEQKQLQKDESKL